MTTPLGIKIISVLLRRRTRLQRTNALLRTELHGARHEIAIVRAAHIARLQACAACPLCAGGPVV